MLRLTGYQIAIAVLITLNTSAHAEPGPVGHWLMNQPLTLWDYGMMRARERADDAAKRVAEQLDAQEVGAWTFYNWENNEITVSVTVQNFPEELSHANCNTVRRLFIARMIGIVPAWGSATRRGAAIPLIHHAIGQWFSHDGFVRRDRDEQLSEKLARIVFVGVALISGSDSPDSNGLYCRARIVDHDAPSKPYSLSDLLEGS